MRIFTTVLSFMLISLCTSVQAVEPVTDHQVMLYYSIPIGANNNEQKQHKFGLRFDRSMHDPREAVDISSVVNRPAMLDLQFQQQNRALAFRVNGIDVTRKLYVQRADAAEGEDTGPKAAMEEEATMEEAATTEGEVAAEGETATETGAVEGETTTEDGTAEVKQAEAEKPKKTIVQETLDELPFGVIMGVAIGIAIFAGVGG